MENIKKTALVTGASSGIGLAVALKLLQKGYFVYGTGRNFSREDTEVRELLQNQAFHPVVLDLTDISGLNREIGRIRKETEIDVLVNNAGVGYFGPHEELSDRKIEEMTQVNLAVPMIVTQLLLRDLKKRKGYVFFISSVTAGKTNTHGCAYGATKAGMTSFARSLFEEVRKYGVRVSVLHPDMTRSRFYRNADFCEGDASDTFLESGEVAEAVSSLLDQREGLVVTELTIRPQKHQIKRNQIKKSD